MSDYYQTELDLKIKKDNQSTPADGLKIPTDPFERARQELREKACLYSRGGAIHYGIPPKGARAYR